MRCGALQLHLHRKRDTGLKKSKIFHTLIIEDEIMLTESWQAADASPTRKRKNMDKWIGNENLHPIIYFTT